MTDKRTTMQELLANTQNSLKENKDTSTLSSVILPLIERVLPNLIANDIMGVQPMSSPYSKEDWPYQVDVLEFGKYTDIIPMRQWCRETLNEGEWVAIAQYFAFKTEEALVWFKLRWL